jgi:hypothetical protein
LNNNNRNNRRRGRGNRTQGGNGNQLNRIDSRARGNAPQMLEKYKKLAQDAQHNGDRVQMEYYLQFADHYFRVIADNKARQDEGRGPGANGRRNDERDQSEDYGDEDMDFGRRSEQASRPRYEPMDQDSRGNTAEGDPGQEGEPFLMDDRDDGGRDDYRDDDRGEQPQRQQNARRQQRKPRDDNRAERPERTDRPERAARPERSEAPRNEKPAPRARKPRKPADDDRGSIDSSILPPSIRGDDAGGDSDGALETVG